jgi:hypothetical protein
VRAGAHGEGGLARFGGGDGRGADGEGGEGGAGRWCEGGEGGGVVEVALASEAFAEVVGEREAADQEDGEAAEDAGYYYAVVEEGGIILRGGRW